MVVRLFDESYSNGLSLQSGGLGSAPPAARGQWGFGGGAPDAAAIL